MKVEFSKKLKIGKLVYIVGIGSVLHNCDCSKEIHNHVQDVEICSVVEHENGSDKEWNTDQIDLNREEIESAIIQEIYDEIA